MSEDRYCDTCGLDLQQFHLGPACDRHEPWCKHVRGLADRLAVLERVGLGYDRAHIDPELEDDKADVVTATLLPAEVSKQAVGAAVAGSVGGNLVAGPGATGGELIGADKRQQPARGAIHGDLNLQQATVDSQGDPLPEVLMARECNRLRGILDQIWEACPGEPPWLMDILEAEIPELLK